MSCHQDSRIRERDVNLGQADGFAHCALLTDLQQRNGQGERSVVNPQIEGLLKVQLEMFVQPDRFGSGYFLPVEVDLQLVLEL